MSSPVRPLRLTYDSAHALYDEAAKTKLFTKGRCREPAVEIDVLDVLRVIDYRFTEPGFRFQLIVEKALNKEVAFGGSCGQ